MLVPTGKRYAGEFGFAKREGMTGIKIPNPRRSKKMVIKRIKRGDLSFVRMGGV